MALCLAGGRAQAESLAMSLRRLGGTPAVIVLARAGADDGAKGVVDVRMAEAEAGPGKSGMGDSGMAASGGVRGAEGAGGSAVKDAMAPRSWFAAL